MASENGQGNAEGRDAERGSAEGEQGGVRASGSADGEGPAKARSGGVRSSGTDSASPRKVKKTKDGTLARGEEIAEAELLGLPVTNFSIDRQIRIRHRQPSLANDGH